MWAIKVSYNYIVLLKKILLNPSGMHVCQRLCYFLTRCVIHTQSDLILKGHRRYVTAPWGYAREGVRGHMTGECERSDVDQLLEVGNGVVQVDGKHWTN